MVVILLLGFAFPSPAYAQGIVYGDTIPSGTTIDHDVVLIGQNVKLDGTVNGNVFILGNQVSINGTIDGSLILIGQNVSIGGKVSGAVYSTVLTLELAPTAVIGRDLYVLTVSLVSSPASQVQRDLFAMSLDAGLNGQVGRSLHTTIGPIQLYNGLMQLLGFKEFTIKLHFDLPTPAPGQGRTGNGMASINLTHMRARSLPAEATPFDWQGWGINILREWIVLALIGWLVLWLSPGPLEKAGSPFASRPFRTTAVGLVVLVIVFNLFVLALLLAAVIFSLGLGLNFLGLWQLSIALWIASYACLALILVGLWLFVVYGSKIIIVSQLARRWPAGVNPPAPWIKAVVLGAGMLIYVLLRSVPYIGWVFAVLVTAAGLGSCWLDYRARRTGQLPVPGAAPVPSVTPAPSRRGRKSGN